MNVLIYIVAALFIFAGAGSLLTKSRNPTLRAMTPLEHIATCLILVLAGILAATMTHWLPIVLGLIVLWALRTIFSLFRGGRLPVSPPLSSREFSDPKAINDFIHWWISNDPQVSEVEKPSTQAMWNEGHRPDDCDSEFTSATDYFKDALQRRLKCLQNRCEADWVDELQNTGNTAFKYLQKEIDIGEQYGVDFEHFHYETAIRKITDSDALNSFNHYHLSEILLSNQRRLLMWLFHDQFGKWYTPQQSQAQLMRFNVRLFRGTTPVIVNGMHLCLGHLILMMHTAAKNGIADFKQFIDLAAKVFDEFDGATEADSSLPFFDRAFHYRFRGIGAWGAGNVSGMLELLFRGDDFLQVGVQVAISRVMLFGTKRSISNVIKDLLTAAEASYKQQFPEPIGFELGALSHISDEVSHCYLSIMPSDRPVITCRIGNRALWDNAEPMFGA